LRREGSFVKPVKRDQALVIHHEKKGHFTIHVGQSGKKEGPSKCCKGRETLVYPEGGNEGPKSVPEGCVFVEILILRLLLTRNSEKLN
jgi:hypothetical protein